MRLKAFQYILLEIINKGEEKLFIAMIMLFHKANLLLIITIRL